MNEKGALFFQLSQLEVIQRSYGKLYLLSAREAGLIHLQSLLMVIEPGKQTSKHFHPNEEIFFVIKGSIIFIGSFGERTVSLYNTIIVPSNQSHQIKNASDTEACEIIISLSPPRKPSEVVYC